MTIFWVILIVFGLYVAEALVFPIRTCKLCDGSGRHESPVVGFRPCRCDGGYTVKWPARLLMPGRFRD